MGKADKIRDFDCTLQSFPIDRINRGVLAEVVFEEFQTYVPIGIDFDALDVLVRPLVERIKIAGKTDAQAGE